MCLGDYNFRSKQTRDFVEKVALEALLGIPYLSLKDITSDHTDNEFNQLSVWIMSKYVTIMLGLYLYIEEI